MSRAKERVKRTSANAVWVGVLVCLPSLVALPESGAAQTAQLEEDAKSVIDALAAQGIADSEGLLSGLKTAWDSDRSEEYRMLRALGVSSSDEEFDAAWQTQPNRSAFFDSYDLEAFTTDMLRSWAKVRPRDAFTWLYAVRDRFDYSLPLRQCFQRLLNKAVVLLLDFPP